MWLMNAKSSYSDRRGIKVVLETETLKCHKSLSKFHILSMCLAHHSLPDPSLTRGPEGGSRPPSLSAADRPPSDTSIESMSSRWEKIQSRARSRTLLCRNTRTFNTALWRETNRWKIVFVFFLSFTDLCFQISTSIYTTLKHLQWHHCNCGRTTGGILRLRTGKTITQLDCLFQISKKKPKKKTAQLMTVLHYCNITNKSVFYSSLLVMTDVVLGKYWIVQVCLTETGENGKTNHCEIILIYWTNFSFWLFSSIAKLLRLCK